jgi:hypothetical protein
MMQIAINRALTTAYGYGDSHQGPRKAFTATALR